jgi:hypothetical protein
MNYSLDKKGNVKNFMKNRSGTDVKTSETLPLERVCRNVKNSMFVILNPSPVTLSPSPTCHPEPRACHLERSEGSAQGKLREESQRINELQNRDSSANASE